MINLTHNETSAVDIDLIWLGEDNFKLVIRFNEDDEDDINIEMQLTKEELEIFRDYLNIYMQAPMTIQ
jgi:hypothetical protein